MTIILALLFCCQSLEENSAQYGDWKKDIDLTSRRLVLLVREGTLDKIASELDLLDKKFADAGDNERKLIAMSAFLSTINSEARAIAFEKGERDEPTVRRACRQHAEAIVNRELSIPANPEMLKAQLTTLLGILDQTQYQNTLVELKQDDEFRGKSVRQLVTVWTRVAKSYSIRLQEFPEDVMNGEQVVDLPPTPPSLRRFMVGVAPDAIADKKLRKEYEAHLANVQVFLQKLHDARETSSVRMRHIQGIRRFLERLYGTDRKNWDELRKVVDETVEDKVQAQQILKELTRKKNP